jgi:DegV family protein with EDD domain
MKYKIVADSSCDLTKEMKKQMNIELAPLKLQLGDKVFIDDENLNVLEYVQEMNAFPTAPKTACPSPQDFIERYEGDESVFVVTLSKELSGTYNSAVLGRDIYLEENKDKFIHVFNSKGASSTETLISLKIEELAKAGNNEQQIVEKVENYISSLKTFFLLESLEHLAKAGRLNHLVAKIASLLSIKAIMGNTQEGTIRLVEKVRGYKKAFIKFVDTVGAEGENLEERVLGIAHCNCPERAQAFKEEVEKRYKFKDIIIVPMNGLSSTYADDGGLVIAF